MFSEHPIVKSAIPIGSARIRGSELQAWGRADGITTLVIVANGGHCLSNPVLAVTQASPVLPTRP